MAGRPNPTEDEILEFLKKPGNAGKRMSAKVVGQELGFQGKKSVNSQLYSLKDKGLVTMDKEQPPRWELSELGAANPSQGQVRAVPKSIARAENTSEKVYVKTEIRDGSILFFPTTVQELTTDHPPSQPSSGDPGWQKSRMVPETPLRPLTDPPDDPVCEPEPETQGPSLSGFIPRRLPDSPSPTLSPPGSRTPVELASLDSVSASQIEVNFHDSSAPRQTEADKKVALMSEEMSKVSLHDKVCTDAPTEPEESNEPSDTVISLFNIISPQCPVPLPRRHEPLAHEREAVIRVVQEACKPLTFVQLKQHADLRRIRPEIVQTIVFQSVQYQMFIETLLDGEKQWTFNLQT